MDEAVQEFVAETREAIEALDSELVRFEQSPQDPELLGGVFRLIHTMKGACGFIGLPRLQNIAHAAETVLGGFRDGSTAVTSEAVSAVLEAVDLIRVLIERLARDGVETPGDDTALVARLWAASQAGGDEAPHPAPAPALEPPEPAAGEGPLIARIGGDATLDCACEMAIAAFGEPALLCDPDLLQAVLRDGLSAVARGLADASDLLAKAAAVGVSAELVGRLTAAVAENLRQLDIAEADADALLRLASGDAPAQAIAPAAPEPPVASTPATAAPAPPAAPEAEAPAAQTIRVSVEALEHLMTVASELVLIRNQLMQVLRLDPESPFAAPLNRLNQVTSELQEGVMTTRMQPINGAWAKLPRLVRDLARDLGKIVELVMHGRDTELDRQVLELIKDPLTHMIRNAVDHGLETPDERRAAGKAEAGRITLSARHEGGAIVIEMADDGRGLNAARIRAKALSQGVVTQAQAEAMSDAEARRLVFLPGFSTAAEVTAVSGRGVGMDVVRTNIEKIGGAIELASVEGAGTRFTIRIPLTLTIVSALIVECCGERFAMPQSSLVELVSANDASGRRIEQVNGAAVLRLRDRLLPLISLQSVLALPAEAAARSETCIVVVRVGAFSFGVIVDRVFDTEEIVVKPVASVLRHLKLFSGATILGDGSVIMILDFKSMAVEAGSAQAAAEEDEAAEPPPAAAARETILVFRALNATLKAAPLAKVARIEEVSAHEIEQVDGRSVIQYRGRLMPVVGADGAGVALEAGGAPQPMLVFTQEAGSVGLLVGEIVDTVEASLAVELKPGGAGSLGSLIIAGQAAELIDVDYFWRTAMEPPEEAPQRVGAIPLPAVGGRVLAGSKRLLVVDRSPFCQLLLKPLLAQAGYQVAVASDAAEALAMHDAGEAFDLIMVDTSARGEAARAMADTFARAVAWHPTPLLGLGLHKAEDGLFDQAALLDAVSSHVDEGAALDLRGAA